MDPFNSLWCGSACIATPFDDDSRSSHIGPKGTSFGVDWVCYLEGTVPQGSTTQGCRLMIGFEMTVHPLGSTGQNFENNSNKLLPSQVSRRNIQSHCSEFPCKIKSTMLSVRTPKPPRLPASLAGHATFRAGGGARWKSRSIKPEMPPTLAIQLAPKPHGFVSPRRLQKRKVPCPRSSNFSDNEDWVTALDFTLEEYESLVNRGGFNRWKTG